MLNSCQFIGHLGRDPELKTFGDGGRVANFSIAVSERWKDKNSGEQKEKTEWVNVAVKSEGLVGVVDRFLRKGSKVYVQGKLQTRKWQDQSGNDRYSTEVVLQGFDAKIVMLDGKPAGDDRGSAVADNATYGQDRRSAQQAHSETRQLADLDDDVPF